MKVLVFFAFIFTLIPLAALGHDLYLVYYVDETIDLNQPFKASDVGWLWVQYAPDSYDYLKDMLSPGPWESIIKPILPMKAVIVGAVPAAIIYLYMIIGKLFGLPPFEGAISMAVKKRKMKGHVSADDLDGTSKRKKVKYSRK